MTTAHEPRRGPGVHLSVEDLSALAEGAQPTAEGASEHLLDCAACREEVNAIGQLLAAFETLEPPQLPPDVAIRIDAALAREAAARASSPNADAAAATASASTSGAASRRRRWRPSRSFGVGLASLATLAGGLALAINLVSSNGQSGGASAASGAAAKPNAATTSGPMRAQGEFGSSGTLAPTAPLAVWVKQALSGTRPDLEVNSPCLANPVFSKEEALRVVNGTYQGVPATLVVYANGSDAMSVRAVVYAQPCTAPSYQELAQGIVAK